MRRRRRKVVEEEDNKEDIILDTAIETFDFDAIIDVENGFDECLGEVVRYVRIEVSVRQALEDLKKRDQGGRGSNV